ncbi:MAG: dephospho-CoA kinase [Bacteroidetes bacterium]|nr:dephospho-CoA kinase [Bacteroidota bacterium]MDA0973839.1 dephospho-CoA kinase [Bacteroidota bacterium]
MKRIGLTGGIGSGKTTVAKLFATLGAPIYMSDDRAKALMHSDLDLKQAITERFGQEVYPKGELDRKSLADRVFSNPAELADLNALVHPAVGQDFRAWLETMEQDGHPYIIKEAAILFETGADKEMDEVIVVTAPESLRIDRVMKRDGVDEASVRARISKQWTEEDKLERADHVIVNDGEHSLIEQVLALNKQFRRNQ